MPEKFIPNPNGNKEPLSENILFDDDIDERNNKTFQEESNSDRADLKNIKVPVEISNLISELNEAINQASDENDVTDAELAKKLKWTTKKVKFVRDSAKLEQTLSLDDLNDRYELWLADQNPEDTEDLPIHLHETMPSAEESVEDQALEQAKKDWIHEKLDKRLNEREKRIIKMRFGIEDGQPHTLKEIARNEGVTPQVVRKIEDRAMKKLRRNANNDLFGDKRDRVWIDKANPQQYGNEMPKISEEIIQDMPSNPIQKANKKENY